MEKKVKQLASLALIIGLSITGITIFISYESSKKDSGYYEITKEGKNISEIEINNQIQKGDINFIPLSQNSSNILEAEWKINYKGFSDPKKFVIITYEEQQSILKISCTLKNPDDIKQLNLNISFSQEYNNYSFKSDSRNANIKFNSHKINFSEFEILTSSGIVDVQLNKSLINNDFIISTISGDINLILDHLIFSKNFLCTSDSGDQFFDIWNIRFLSHSNFNTSALSGRINIKWANHFNKSHNINVNLNSHNDVYLKMWSPIEITKYDIFYESSNGTARFSKSAGLFEEISSNHYHSYNINKSRIDLCNISALTTYGEVHVFIVDCFKWQRFCVQANDFLPDDVHNSGEFIIPQEDHDVTTIEFYNLNYIYLNSSKYLDINFQSLPVTSENIIYLKWDLTYQHAMGIGVGSIGVDISNKTEGNIIEIYFDLEYELDRIVPTFTDYNITAFVHPNYSISFYNYTK